MSTGQQPRELHPIAVQLALAYGMEGNPKIQPSSLEEAQNKLLSLGTCNELKWALRSLVKVASILESERCAVDEAEDILRMCDRAVPLYQSLAEKKTSSAVESFMGFMKQQEVKSAPKFGARAPTGSLSVASLRPRTKFQ